MTRLRLLAAGVALTAAVPAPAAEPMTAKAEAPAGRKLEGGAPRPYAPRADTFVPGVLPNFLHQLVRRGEPFRRAATAIPNSADVVFFARTRPVRIRMQVTVNGKPLADHATAVMNDMFAAFDRDGDGRLNKYEVELILTRTEFRNLVANGYGGFRGANAVLPTLDLLDKDDDRRVNRDEFAEFYATELANVLRTAASVQNPNQTVDTVTAELFARLDKNKDGKLSETELKQAEKILLALDADEDECVTAAEIRSAPSGDAMMMATGDAMMATGSKPQIFQNTDLHVSTGGVPVDVLQRLLTHYDKNGDGELSHTELALDPAAFDALDANRDGKLTATELEAWRTGDPDLTATVDLAAAGGPSKVTVKAAGRGAVGIDLPKQTGADRTVIRIGTQTLDLGVMPTPAYSLKAYNPYAGLFNNGKKYLDEKDVAGPQYQYLRVIYDSVDFDGDGRLTLAELDRYLDMQRTVARLGVAVSYAVRTPNLFQLLDANGDGRLGIKELRTAFDRLTPLEPSGKPEVTKAVLQPSVTLRVANTVYGQNDPNVQAMSYGPGETPGPKLGPIWFRKADRNGDGDLSRGEFLGTKTTFDAIDSDRDGLISLAEAEAYDATTRKK